MNVKFSRLLSAIGLLFLLCSCAKTGETVNKHEPEKSTQFQVAGHSSGEVESGSGGIWIDPTDSTSGRFLGQDLEFWQERVTHSEQPLNEVLLPLAQEVWNPVVLQDPRIHGTKFYQRGLRFLNEEILKHLEQKESREEVYELLRKGIGEDCFAQLINCTSLEALQTDTGSAQVLSRLLLRTDSEIPRAERRALTLIAIDLMKSKPAFPELEELAFREAGLLSELNGERDFAARQMVQGWNDMLSNVLSAYAAESRKTTIPPHIRDYLIASNWQTALTTVTPLMGLDQKTVLRLAHRAGLFEDGFRKLQQDWGSQSEFLVGLNQLKKNQSGLYRNLELPEPKNVAASPALFVMDGVYGRRLLAESGTELLLYLNLNPKQFQDVLDQYIQLRFALLLAKTSNYMATELKRNDITTIQFYIDVVQRSKGIAIQWESLVRDAGELRRLALIFLDLTPHSQDREQVRVDVESLITGLPMNIKQMAVYPNMLMMIYYLAQADFNVTIKTFFGVFSINTDDILLSLMTGSLYPFFQFGTDGQAMAFIDVLYSVVYALKTDTFSTFGIDKIDFLKMLSTKYLEQDAGVIRQDLKKLQSHFEGHQSDYRRFQTICGTLARRDCDKDSDYHPICANETVLSKAEDHVPELYLKAEELRSRVFHGVPGTTITAAGGKELGPNGISPEFLSGELFYLIPGKNSDFSQNLSDTVEIARNDLREKLRILDVIFNLTVKHLNDRGDSAEAARTQRDLQAHIQPFRDLLNGFLNEVLQRELEIGDCYSYMVVKEQEARAQVFEAEERHLRFVHQQMKKVRSGESSLAELNEPLLANSTVFERLKSLDWYRAFALDHQETGFNFETVGFTKDYYNLSTIQFFARLTRYLEEGADYIHLEALAPFTRVEFPIAIEKLGRNLETKRIDWTASEDEFVRRGFEALFGRQWPMADWLSLNRTGFNFGFRTLTRVRLLASLYKFGDIEGVNDSGLETLDDCQQDGCFRLSPKKLIDNVLRIYELLAINERDEKWIRLSGRQGKAGEKVDLRNIAYKYIDKMEESEYSGLMSPLDFVFQLVNAVSIDKSYIPGLGSFIVEPSASLERRRVPIPFAADFFFSHCYSAGQPLYPVINEFQDELEKYFRREVQKDWLRRQEMVEASDARYREDIAKGDLIIHYHYFAEGKLDMPYLSKQYPSNFRAQWTEFFEKKTQGFYSIGQEELLCRSLR